MNKICDLKFEIEDLEITINKAITIKILNSLDFFSAQSLSILSHQAWEKKNLSIFESLAIFLEDKKLHQIKNQDKTIANYAKRFTNKNNKPLNQTKKSEDFIIGSLSKQKFCE